MIWNSEKMIKTKNTTMKPKIPQNYTNSFKGIVCSHKCVANKQMNQHNNFVNLGV